MKRRGCLLDLDGVLVDLWGGAQRLAGKFLPPAELRWEISEQLGYPTHESFWGLTGYDFWVGLGWSQEGRRLVRGLEAIYGRDNIALLTSPVDTKGAIEGKVDWIRANMPEYRRQFFVGPPKHLVASPSVHLVDDHDDNVDKFKSFGGTATLVPRPWNRRRGETNVNGRFDVELLLQEIAAGEEVARHG